MGILNVTPDSFSDGGRWLDPQRAVEHARAMVAAGAHLVDVGGESTRPGAEPVDETEEAARVVPVVRAIARSLPVPVSVDTRRADVAAAALDQGALIVNDVSALRDDPRLAEVAARRGAGVILMHMQGTPRTMQRDPRYADVVADVRDFLAARLAAAERAGIDPERVALDPGFGFGKTVEHNLVLLRRLDALAALGRPIVAGTSRKSFIGRILDLPVDARVEGTAATVALAVAHGAAVVRVHDVAAMARVAAMTDAVLHGGTA
jgi:dihydropteroate synthase